MAAHRRWELVTALGIAACLAVYLPVHITATAPRARMQQARTDLRQLSAFCLGYFKHDHGRLPKAAEWPEGLRRYCNVAATPRDPWDRPYVYEPPGAAHPDVALVKTLGRDGRPGGEGEDADLQEEAP